MTTPTLGALTELDYPETDGKPMAETDFQRIPLSYAVDSLDLYFDDQPDVYVSGNILMYYEEGRTDRSVAPDVLVTFGIPKAKRRTYRVWQEGKAPDFVMEITSKGTASEDQGTKWGLYAYLGVREYFQYDPTGDYLRPVLQAWRLVGRTYALQPSQSLNGSLSVYSEVLGLELRADLAQGEMRFYDPKTGQRLLSRKEAERARLQAEQARQVAEQRTAQETAARLAAEQRAAQAEAEVARLLAELKRLRGE